MRRGVSLVELLVAIVVLELAIVAAFGSILLVERIRRGSAAGASTDGSRWQAWQSAEQAPWCRSGSPAAVPLMLPRVGNTTSAAGGAVMRSVTRGVTLVELLISITVLGIVASLAGGAVHAAARAARAAIGSAARRRSEVAFHALVRHDLGAALDGDPRPDVGGSLRYPQPIGAAVACTAAGSHVIVSDDAWNGARLPVAGRDSAWLLIDLDGTWIGAAVVGVTGATCAGRSAIDITVDRPVVHPIVRVYESVRVGAYASGGVTWLGMLQGGAGSTQPFGGPLVSANSLWSLSAGVVVAQLQLTGSASPTWVHLTLPPP